jgi:UDP-3-O-[3-hydroxymyristoyl] glucosamine N-acyltransferase
MPASSVTTGQIASFLSGTLVGSPEIPITGAAALTDATPTDLSFLQAETALQDAMATRAGAILTAHVIPDLSRPQIVVARPALAMTKVVTEFFVARLANVGLSNLAHIGKNVTLGQDVSIWPFVTLDDAASVGRGTRLYPGVFVGRESIIGEECVLYSNVTVREGVTIGNRVIIHPGAVIGSDGFGYLQHDGRNHKIPQIGTVVIEDDVELGANVTVDRATYGATVIRRGTKVDNLVQIAHNVKIGEDNIIVAQVGIAGSSTTGHHVMIGGQAGIADHVAIGNQVMIAARTGVVRDVGSHEVIAGFPAMPHKAWLRSTGVIAKLPELRQQLRELERRLAELEAATSRKSPGARGKRPAPSKIKRSALGRKR